MLNPLPTRTASFARISKTDACDIYVLMVGTFPEFRCASFAFRNEMFAKSSVTDLGWGRTYALPQESPQPIEKLDKVIRYIRRHDD